MIPPNHPHRSGRSPMGLGSIALGAIATLFAIVGWGLSIPHELASIGLVIAISGVAVAIEGRRVETDKSDQMRSIGLWFNVIAFLASIACIMLEIARRRGGG